MNLDILKKKWGPYFLSMAIGIHAIFAGISIGLETDLGGLIGITVAVISHKWVEALLLVILFKIGHSFCGIKY